MSELSNLIVEKRKLVQQMLDEITLIRSEFTPKIQAITKQINLMKQDKKPTIAKTIRKFKRR